MPSTCCFYVSIYNRIYTHAYKCNTKILLVIIINNDTHIAVPPTPIASCYNSHISNIALIIRNTAGMYVACCTKIRCIFITPFVCVCVCERLVCWWYVLWITISAIFGSEEFFQFPLQCFKSWPRHGIISPTFSHDFVQLFWTAHRTWHAITIL